MHLQTFISKMSKYHHQCITEMVLYPAWNWWGTYLGYCSQKGRNSELRLRWAVGQAAHTLNNPHVECFIVCNYGIIAVKTELYW